jgi:hypothetical protein
MAFGVVNSVSLANWLSVSSRSQPRATDEQFMTRPTPEPKLPSLRVNLSKNKPLHQQISDWIKRAILSGSLAPGARLTTLQVRDRAG